MPPARTRPVRCLLSAANVIPRKDHRALVTALAQLRDLAWELRCVGSLARDPETARALRAQIDAAGLARRVALWAAAFDRFATA